MDTLIRRTTVHMKCLRRVPNLYSRKGFLLSPSLGFLASGCNIVLITVPAPVRRVIIIIKFRIVKSIPIRTI